MSADKILPATPITNTNPGPLPDPRVSAMDDFTPTTHAAPCRTLLSALSPPSPPASPAPANFSTVLVLGASRGIGAGVALTYARAGAATLVLAARSVARLSPVAESVRKVAPACAVHVRECDVGSPTSVRALAGWVREEVLRRTSEDGRGKRLDAVVVNAGYSGHVETRVTEGDAEDGQWARAFAVNALGTYHAAHYFVPLLLGGGGGGGEGRKAFLVVGSIAGCIRRGVIANSKYCISKMAQVRVVEHVAEQFGGKGLLAVAVHPGAVETAMAVETAPEAFKKYLVDDPELCGHFLVWLTRVPGRFQWLNGRLISANWDPDELLAKKDEVIAGDLLKFEAKAR